MSRTNAIRRAVCCALSERATAATLVGCTLLLTAAPSSAQESTARSADNVTEVVVVGSRIRRDTFNAPSPVQIVTRDETLLAGFNSTAETLQGTAVTTGAGQINNAFGGFVTDGGPGANTLSLRGLGAGRTLILINGRRLAPAGTRGALGSADLNVLPNAIVERVEILRDGASSIYGSDAVAGVVNVITRDNIDDLTFEAQYNRPTEGDGEQSRFSVVGGTSGERWSFNGSLEYYERGSLTLADRDWTKCSPDNYRDPDTGESLDYVDPLTGAPKCQTISGTGSNGVTINTIGTQAINSDPTSPNYYATLGLNGAPQGAPGSAGTVFNRFRPNSAVTTGVVGFEGVGGGINDLNVRDTFDPRMLNEDLISPAKVFTAFLQGDYALNALGDGEIYFEFLGSERRSEQTGYRQLSMDYRRGSPLIPASLAFSDFGPDQGTSGGSRVGVRAFVGFGNDKNEQVVDYFKPTLGLKGDLAFVPDWRYDMHVSHSKSDAEYRQQSFLTDKLTYASDVVTAPATTDASLVRNGLTCAINITNPAERCIPFPPLNSATVGGDLPRDFVDYIFRDIEGNTKYDETVFSAIIDGPIFSLPAGSVQAVVGVEHRRAEIDDTPDPNSIASNLYNLTSATPTRGKDNVSEAYTEVEVPLLANMSLVNELTFNGSFRFTDYDSYGSDTTYKLGLMYSPIDWVSLRVTKGTSFRAPALYEQFQGPTSGFLSAGTDPCDNRATGKNATRTANCAAEGLTPTFQQTSGIRVFSEGGAAAGLEAETSDNITYGLILQPSLGAFGELSFAVDYFDIEINNGVDQPGATNILPRCYDDPDFRAGGGLCRLVTRDPVTRALTVSNAYTNIATQVSKGLDFTLRYEHELGAGTVQFDTQLTRYKTQTIQLFPDDPADQYNGTLNSPQWSGTAYLTYSMGDWRFRYGVDWIDDMNSYGPLWDQDRATSPFDMEVGNYYEHFASIRYTNEEWQVTAGMRNIFNEEPPTISQSFYNRVGSAPLYSGYDYVGREAFLHLSKQF